MKDEKELKSHAEVMSFSLDKQNNICQVTLAAAQVTDFNI